MKTILFSAVFNTSQRPERLRFLTNVLQSFPEPVRFVAFNLSGKAEADFEIVDGTGGFKPNLNKPHEYLANLLKQRSPSSAKLLMDHVHGEFGKNTSLYEKSIEKIIYLILEFERQLDKLNPDYVYLWNQFNSFHSILAELLVQRSIKYGFFHDGVLPGSIALDADGEMGESWIAREPQKFMDVTISESDIKRARNFIDNQGVESINRHPQIEEISVREALFNAKLDGRPIVFLAGQNDWHSGIKPRSDRRCMHSHIFPGSAEALVAMDQIAGDLGVTILFKPHPLSKDKYTFLRQEDLKNSLIISSTSMQACLDAADLVATIASQTCYVALMANKPVLMLGKNQVTDKGLTYDAKTESEIHGLIKQGIEDPLSGNRRQTFARHVAQLERVYLFDYNTINTDYYRRGAIEAAEYMKASTEFTAKDVIKMQITS